MKFVFFLSLLIFSVTLSAQNNFQKLNCDEFELNITSNLHSSVRFLNKESYSLIIKDSIQKKKPSIIKENTDLYKEFQIKFPKKITTHCIHSKYNYNDSIRYLSYCDSATTLTLIKKEYQFYIFKEKGYEIDNFILFNTENQTIYSTKNEPIILENGKSVFDIGHSYGGYQMVNYYKFGGEKTEYLKFTLPLHYEIKDFKLVNKYNNIKVALEIIKYDFKKRELNDKSEFYIDNCCRKFLLIN